MRVLVTGGTGLVGCHTIAALRAAGHEVRMLVRDPQRIPRALGPFGIDAVDHAVGEITDERAVSAALAGCDAIVHAAALFTLDRRRDEEVQRTNVVGSEIVLGSAVRRGLDPVIYVSSVSALFPPDGDCFTPDTSVKHPKDAYARSKADAERFARGLQEEGAPVVITYPGGVWGPRDPTHGDGVRIITSYLRRGFMPVPPGGIPIVDARDVAAVHAAAMRPGRGPRRYMIGGTFLNNRELAEIVSDLTGRRILAIPVPAAVLLGIGALGDVLRRLASIDIGLTYEAIVTLVGGVPCDDSRAAEELGVVPRPVRESRNWSALWGRADISNYLS